MPEECGWKSPRIWSFFEQRERRTLKNVLRSPRFLCSFCPFQKVFFEEASSLKDDRGSPRHRRTPAAKRSTIPPYPRFYDFRALRLGLSESERSERAIDLRIFSPRARRVKKSIMAEVSPSRKQLFHKRSMDCVLSMDSVAPSLREQLRHTYSANNVLSPRRKSADIRLVARHADVYEPCDDSFALVDALLADRSHLAELQPKLCMEIGCGSGYVISSLALMLRDEVESSQYVATDINQAATETTLETLKAHGVSADVVRTDLVSGLERRLAGSVDLLVFNPPYVPTPEDEVGAPGITGTWAGGDRGRVVIDRLLGVVDGIISSRGCFYLVTLTANNPGEICRIMQSKGFASRIAVQRHTEEESLHVLKFWRRNSQGSSSSSSSSSVVAAGSSSSSSPSMDSSTNFSSPLMCLPQKISRLAFWK
ncbi:uncharacterized protein LOC9655195 isoform X3 [Selaginella moellendorffii]|uniref:uncharacterized protein LOC9655195 isoform X3 n=1 Tax=Selaginella moellendorffii TaxID=88036 RepID=UPI000D1CE32C|nr:uncharacterized protein LOC9655195 isoform X3 [Selaginella moellendorffii]|eukprot:XP_024524003.1 uncharacterized protein LOC9655195 isoform X3 [Selaginella moellendorffii]